MATGAAPLAAPAGPLPAVKGCGKQCMGTCCLPGSTLPLYVVPGQRTPGQRVKPVPSLGDLSTCSSSSTSTGTPGKGGASSEESSGSDSSSEDQAGEHKRRSFLDSLMTALWDERAEEGLFRYDVAACETKVIPGPLGLIAQFNEGRHSKKRPTEFSMDAVMQPYDATKFNFTKVGQREALFAFEEQNCVLSEGTPSAFEEGSMLPELAPQAGSAAVFLKEAVVGGSAGGPNIVAINVSPIEYGHMLLIPRIHSRTPQRIDKDSLLLALHFAAELNNPFFRMGYNSLGAFATVNHLHFQGYYLNRQVAIEMAAHSAPIRGGAPEAGSEGTVSRTVTICELQGYPVRGLVFTVGESHKELAEAVAAACEAMQRENMPFNLFITACGSRVFFFPQCYAERQAKGEVESELLDTQVNPAVFEITGHMVMKRREDFDGMTEELAARLLAAVSLTEAEFERAKGLCLEAVQAVLPLS